MKKLIDYINDYSHSNLNELESEIGSEIDAIISHSNRLKVYVIISIMMDKFIKAVKNIDTSNFLEEIQNRNRDIIDEHNKKINIIKSQFSCDIDIYNVLKGLDDSDAIQLEDTIREKLSAYEAALSTLIIENDKTPIVK